MFTFQWNQSKFWNHRTLENLEQNWIRAWQPKLSPFAESILCESLATQSSWRETQGTMCLWEKKKSKCLSIQVSQLVRVLGRAKPSARTAILYNKAARFHEDLLCVPLPQQKSQQWLLSNPRRMEPRWLDVNILLCVCHLKQARCFHRHFSANVLSGSHLVEELAAGWNGLSIGQKRTSPDHTPSQSLAGESREQEHAVTASVLSSSVL